MANGYLQALYESIPGNETNAPTASTKTLFFPLKGANLGWGPNHLIRDDELRNQIDPLSVLPDTFDPSCTITTPAYPDSIGFLLKAMLGAPVTTAGNGVLTDPDAVAFPIGATRHVWTSNLVTGNSPQTSQLVASYKDQSEYYKLKGAACSELQFQISDQEMMLVATMPALFMQQTADPALSPTYEALSVVPFKRPNVTVPTWLASSDASFEGLSWKLTNQVEKVRSMGIASKFPDVLDRADDPIVLDGDVTYRHLKTQDIAAMVAATGFSATIRAVSDSIIASAYPYKLWVSMTNTQYVTGDPDDLQNRRRHGAKFGWKATTSAIGTAAWTITLINATASYA